jgi:hypothetical protein
MNIVPGSVVPGLVILGLVVPGLVIPGSVGATKQPHVFLLTATFVVLGGDRARAMYYYFPDLLKLKIHESSGMNNSHR